MAEPFKVTVTPEMQSRAKLAGRGGAVDQNAAWVIALKSKSQERMQAMENVRLSWWAHHRQVARVVLPRLGRFLEMPNEGTRGRQKSQAILDSTATTSAERAAAGLLAGVASPARPWFQLRVGNKPQAMGSAPRAWLSAVETRMREVFSESNFYRSIATIFEEIVVFGTGAMLVYQDFKDVIRCYPLACGEYYVANDERLDPTVLGRKVVMTVAEITGEFGLDAVSEEIRLAYLEGRHDTEYLIGHMILPNDERVYNAIDARGKPWLEVYWLWTGGQMLAIRGYNEKPFAVARWNVTANDPYGRSMGMTALGDIKQLQVLQKRLSQLVDKLGNPPLVADSVLKDKPTSTVPGAVTFIPPTAGNIGFKSLYDVKPEGVTATTALIQATQQRIKAVFFEDLFLMISQLDTVRTATEIAARKEEKMLMLGPALERLHDELLKPIIDRVYNILVRLSAPMWARGLPGVIPAPPPELAGRGLGIEFVSTLAQAQKAAATATIERLFAFAGNIAAVKPEVMDKLDSDEGIDAYAEAIGAPPSIVVSTEKVQALRAKREQAQQQQMQLQNSVAAAQGAKTLSETDVGGGQNALARMLGTAA